MAFTALWAYAAAQTLLPALLATFGPVRRPPPGNAEGTSPEGRGVNV